jgi:hypothetical protein
LAIGFSVYAFEGVGMILPVYDITEKPEDFKKVVTYVVGTCTFLYIFFGQFCTFAWGTTMTKPLATDNLD